MKRFVWILLVLFVIGMNGCTKKSEGRNNELVVCSPHPVEFIKPLIENFENSTGISVRIIQGGTGEILERIAASGDSPYCDVLWGGSYSNVLPALNLFVDYHSSNEEFIQEEYKNREGPLTRFSDIPSVLMLNRKLLGDCVVEGYADLLKPELKGKIAFSDPEKSSSATEHLINMLYAMGGGDTSSGWEYVRQFSANLHGRLLSSSAQVYKGVSEGKFAVGLTFEEGGANYAVSDDTIELIYMKEGVVFTPDGVYIVKNTKQLEDAQKFVDYLTGKSVQVYMSEILNRRSVRVDVSSKGKMLPKTSMKIIPLDYSYIAVEKKRWVEEFNTIFITGVLSPLSVGQ
ncbi:MAG TPA: extracellular solute-binding protein [Treponemataceae bacterium]|nr:extracellular solute-binding protein [Treponemataceae bacterium]